MSLPTPNPVSLTCCLPGYTYDSRSGLCQLNTDPTQTDLPRPCACCPFGYTFIDGSGQYIDDDLSVKTIVNPNVSAFYNTCAHIVNKGYAIVGPVPVNPIACPCCHTGYTYLSDIGACALNSNPSVVTDPIPCLPCVCIVPPPPPPCIGCQSTPTAPITYNLHPTKGRYINLGGKLCEDCEPEGLPVGLGGCADNFIPLNLTDPIIKFNLNS